MCFQSAKKLVRQLAVPDGSVIKLSLAAVKEAPSALDCTVFSRIRPPALSVTIVIHTADVWPSESVQTDRSKMAKDPMEKKRIIPTNLVVQVLKRPCPGNGW